MVRNCADAVVYLLAPFQYATVANCVDCVVVIGACARALRAEQCERVTVIAASRRFVAKMCHECTFHLGVEKPPAFLGENRGCHVAPYNTFYEQLERHLECAGLEAGACARWDAPVVLGGGGGAWTSYPRRSFLRSSCRSEGKTPTRRLIRRREDKDKDKDKDGLARGGRFRFVLRRRRTRSRFPPSTSGLCDAKVKTVASLRSAARDAGLDDANLRQRSGAGSSPSCPAGDDPGVLQGVAHDVGEHAAGVRPGEDTPRFVCLTCGGLAAASSTAPPCPRGISPSCYLRKMFRFPKG